MPQARVNDDNQLGKVPGPYQLHSLDRAVSVLDFLGESSIPLSLAEICTRMGLHKSTAHRSLMVLERSGLIERTPENRFRLGLKLYQLGNRAVEQVDLRPRVQPFFRRLASQVRETVHLSVLQQTRIVYLDKVEPGSRVCIGSKTGNSNPVYCTSMGKAMLAFQTPEFIEQTIASIDFVRYTPRTLDTPERLMKALSRTRKRGYAVDNEEIEEGVRCVGVPIFNNEGRAVAAVSVSAAASRIDDHNVTAIVESLQRCSRDISAVLNLDLRKQPVVPSHFLSSYAS
jgi:DNA-binding IclR family transcriptional regulator